MRVVPDGENDPRHSQCARHTYKIFNCPHLILTQIVPFRDLSRLGDQIQADICVIIPHYEECLHVGGHILAAEDVRLAIV